MSKRSHGSRHSEDSEGSGGSGPRHSRDNEIRIICEHSAATVFHSCMTNCEQDPHSEFTMYKQSEHQDLKIKL